MFDNVYLRDVFQRIKYKRDNIIFDNIVSEVSQIDSILNYKEFKDYVVKYIKPRTTNGYFMRREFGCDGLFYGQRNAFFEYAGIKNERQNFIFPYFEPGADLREIVREDVLRAYNYFFLFQSSYKNRLVHDSRPWAPVYNIGPYVLYAHCCYSMREMENRKRKNGKTVLLFPGHSFEGVSVDFDKKTFVKNVISKFKNDYDTILVSVYWNDVDDPLYELFEAEGVKLVSAGFRGDQNFINRLRTLIELSDIVASNLAGSYIGFSQALRKPLFIFKERAKYIEDEYALIKEDEEKYRTVLDTIFYAFSSLNPSPKQISMQQYIYNYYWGEEYFKTKEQARDIIDLSKKILDAGKGKPPKIEKIIRELTQGNMIINLKQSQMDLLHEAIYEDD